MLWFIAHYPATSVHIQSSCTQKLVPLWEYTICRDSEYTFVMGGVLLYLINSLPLTLQVIYATTIDQCLDRGQGMSGGDLISSHSIQKNGIIYNIYQSGERLTWCQSYHACRDKGQTMLNIKEYEIQMFVESILRNHSNLYDFVWLGSRRKDYGADWTWITDALADYPCEERECRLQGEQRPVATLFTIPGNTQIKNDLENSDYYICSDGITHNMPSSFTWYEAQRRCSSNGTRLATLSEIDTTSLGLHSYWLGLHYKPWIWIDDTKKKPVIYFRSDPDVSMADDRDCLALRLSDTSWIPKHCSSQSTTVICQSTEGFTVGRETTENSEHLAETPNVPTESTIETEERTSYKNIYIYIGSGLGAAVVCIIIIVLVLVKKGCIRKQRRPDAAAPDHDPGGHHADIETRGDTAGPDVVCGPGPLNNYQPDTLIYDNAVEPSARYPVRTNQQAKPKEDTGDVYSMVAKKGRAKSRSPKDQPLASNAYSLEGPVYDSDTDESDDVVIVDNAVYGGP